jgi:PhnB protein
MQFSTHLNFDGHCREAFQFYAETFGGKIATQVTYADAPAGMPIPEEMRKQIMHARLEIAGQYLMGADAPAGRYAAPKGAMVSVSLSDPVQGKRVFETLSAGGTVTHPFQGTFWARGFGMCIDRYAIPWIVNCEKPNAVPG